jgi:haloalkane dehalogenase
MDASKPLDLTPFRHLYPFASHFFNRNGLKLHYLDEGAGNPVVMLHGNPTWSFFFREPVKALRSRWRVIVPDHMGCGLSDKPGPGRYAYRLQDRIEDLQALLDALDIKDKITMVLHDWGGMIGMAYAVKYPQRIGRLVVLNTAAFPPPDHKRIPLRLRLIRNVRWLAVPAVLGLNLFARGALRLAAHRRLPAEVRAGLVAPYNSWANRIATLRFVEDIPLAQGDPSFHLLQQVEKRLPVLADKPLLICWGARDFVFDIDYYNEWRRRYPRAEAYLYKDAGHYILEDVPAAVTDRIKRFLENNPLD